VTITVVNFFFLLWAVQSGVALSAGSRDFFFSKTSKLALEPTQPANQSVLGACFPWRNTVGDQVDQSLLFSPKAKNGWSCSCTSLYAFMMWPWTTLQCLLMTSSVWKINLYILIKFVLYVMYNLNLIYTNEKW